jgi:hypothetical protein
MCDAKFDLLKLLRFIRIGCLLYFYLIANINKQSPDSTVRVEYLFIKMLKMLKMLLKIFKKIQNYFKMRIN